MKSSNIFPSYAFLPLLLLFFFWPISDLRSQRQIEPERVGLLVVGDWGTGGAGARRVGKAMTAVYEEHGATAVLSTGDNIYPSGVSSVDDPQWDSKFERIFPASELPLPFWAVLGNHDYRKNPDAQVEYTGRKLKDGSITRWHMPGRWWTTVFSSPNDAVSVRVVGVDTQVLILSGANRTRHLAWIDSVLAASKERWIIVMGHHPVYSHGHYGDHAGMKRHVAPLLEKHGVHAYLNGHEHDLQLIRHVNGVRYVISGGGGGKRPTTPGARTEFAASSLGFVWLGCERDRMLIKFVNDKGELLYETIDPHVRDRSGAAR